MAENSFNGHTNGTANGHAPADTPKPFVPRVLPPEGARSARNFDGSPIEIAPVETLAETLEAHAEAAPINDQSAPTDSPMVADFREAFALSERNGDAPDGELPDLDAYAAPPLGISIEKVEPDTEEELPPYDSYPLAQAPDDDQTNGASALGLDAIEGEQLFAGNADTDDVASDLAVASGGSNGGGGQPPSDGISPFGGASDGSNPSRPDTPRDQELGLMEHLRELRSRLIYGISGVIAMMFVTWHFSLQLQNWFAAPIRQVLNSNGVTRGFLMITDPTEAFSIYFQFSLVSALILSMPWVLFQVWRFIEPAMTHSERRYTLVLVPFSSTLFFMGVALGYALSPLFFQFFLQFQPADVAAQWNYVDSIMLMAKMLLIFGLAFQVPIIIIFFNKVGLLSRNLLIEYWRHAVVVIFIVVAILTPTWDPFTMTACAIPPCLLYLLSIWLVKWI